MAVISSPAGLKAAASLRAVPDYFELRLDALYPVLPEAERWIARLRAPLIATARHPAEAGMHSLSPGHRCELLLHFLPRAEYVDVELRAVAEMEHLLQAAKERRVKRIISVHDFRSTPATDRLDEMFNSAKRAGADVFKLVSRTDKEEDVARLSSFLAKNKGRLPLAVMGAGSLGAEARLNFARNGSVLCYGHLGVRQVEGQLSLSEMRRALS